MTIYDKAIMNSLLTGEKLGYLSTIRFRDPSGMSDNFLFSLLESFFDKAAHEYNLYGMAIAQEGMQAVGCRYCPATP